MIKTLLECYKKTLDKQKQNSNINYSNLINNLQNALDDFISINHIADEDILLALLDLKANEPSSSLYYMYISLCENTYDIYDFNSYQKQYYKQLRKEKHND